MADPVITTIGSWEADNVTVGQVDAALSDLRRHEQRAAVRTSVLTLVAVVERREEATEVLDVVRQLGGRHPSRTLVLHLDASGDGRHDFDACVSVHAIERDGRAVWAAA